MRRDMGLIRAILAVMEKTADYYLDGTPAIDGYKPIQVAYHMELCCDAGYIMRRGSSAWRLTWAGHEELEAMRQAV